MLRTFLLVAGLFLLVILVVRLGPGEILGLLQRIGWRIVPLAGLYGGYQAVRAAALRLSASRPGTVTFSDACAVRFAGETVQFLSAAGPFFAEPSKAMLLGRRGLTTVEGFATTLTEYLAYTFVSSVMLAGAMLYLIAQVELDRSLAGGAVTLLAVSSAFLGLAAVAVVWRLHIIGGVIRVLGALPLVGRLVRLEAGPVRQMEDLLLGTLRGQPGRLARILLIEAVAQGLLVIELWWLLQMSGVTFDPAHPLVLESAGKFTGLAFFFIPGQVGATEGVNLVLYQAVGLSGATGVGVALARRLRSALAAGVGLAALAVLTRRSRAARP